VSLESDDIAHDYDILLNELKLYNPELLDKRRLLAISKADLMDDVMIKQLESEIKIDIPYVFISGVSGYGLDKMKDMIWQLINEKD
jgi:GTP-binding protein